MDRKTEFISSDLMEFVLGSLSDDPFRACKKTIEELKPGLLREEIVTFTKVLLQTYERLMPETGTQLMISPILGMVERILSDDSFENVEFVRQTDVELLSIIDMLVRIASKEESSTNMLKLSLFFHKNLDSISESYTSENSNKEFLNFRFRILCCSLQPKSKEFDDLKEKSGLDECQLVTNIIIHSSCDVFKMILFHLRHFFKSFGDVKCATSIWTEISKLFSCKNASLPHTRMLTVLCYLFDYFFSEKNVVPFTSVSNFTRLIFQDRNYWKFVQFGLASRDPLMKKQAMFLLKTTINLLSVTQCEIVCSEVDTTSESNNTKQIMWWDAEHSHEISKLYSELIVILEFLDEQQVHIIKPMFKMLNDFVCKILSKIKIGEKTIASSWILLVYEKALRHESIQVTKWSLQSLLKLSDDFYSNPEIAAAVVDILVQTLNNTNLYYTEGITTSESLAEFFVRFSKLGTAKVFFNSFITSLCTLTWSPESLFFTVHAMAQIPRNRFWSRMEISSLKTFVRAAFKTHNKTIKAGILYYLLNIILALIDEESVNLEAFVLCLASFSDTGALQRGDQNWTKLITWMRTNYSAGDAKICLEKYTSGNSFCEIFGRAAALMMLVFFDAYNDSGKTEFVAFKFNDMLHSFENIEKRPYYNHTVLDGYLYLLYQLLDEDENSDVNLELSLKVPHLRNLIVYIQMRVMGITKLEDHQQASLYVRSFKSVVTCKESEKVQDLLDGLNDKIMSDIADYEKSREAVPPIRMYCWMHLLNILLDKNRCNFTKGQFSFLFSYLAQFVNESFLRDTIDIEKTIDVQTIWGRINSEYLATKWRILEHLMRKMPPNSLSSVRVIALCKEAVELGGNGILVPVMSTLERVLPTCEQIQWKEMSDLLWKFILERRKTDEFKKFTRCFLKMLFQKDLFSSEAGVHEIHVRYADLIFADSSQGVVNDLMKHLQTFELNDRLHPLFSYILAKGLLFGPIQRRDERLTAEVCSLVGGHGINHPREFNGSNEIRARAVAMIVCLNSNNSRHQKFAWELAENLLKMEDNMNKNKLRYFGDSHVHRLKHRLVQALLLLEPVLVDYQNVSEDLSQWLYRGLTCENPQPSVMYLQEWLLIRISRRHPNLMNSFWNCLSDSSVLKTKGLCCLMTVIFHLCRLVSLESSTSWLDKAIPCILPFCMDQHFEVRLHAQVITQKLFQLAQDRNLSLIVQKYKAIDQGVSMSIERGCRGNAARNCKKLQEDFYFTVFNPEKHFTLETIYEHLPRLCNVGSDEWIPIELFRYCGITEETAINIPLKSSRFTLQDISCAKWSVEGGGFADEVSQSSLVNYQKKMIPEKLSFPSLEVVAGRTEDVSDDKKKGSLVVVATLIDRIPNLGGLARTCEVFGASEYVVGSLKYVEDKQFASLSVTAEKWVTLREVKRQNLSDYLVEMKANGYLVVGAEQALHSQPLHAVKLPRKTLILLGSEKEGIPPNLLPLLDVCVEIPQRGIIRSLNVHVTGALFVWEYAKQNYFF
ncbi:hypothetical protein RUM44_011978 [Polyplax serrata]|uniref:tRNA/rRNA methyltransferase SpoU type domain-containing protein n=1 Tax=Polyplax serrata TaxID=468196 RepID=A0ABR1BDZ1_POLSC